jgi:hypothetical protein
MKSLILFVTTALAFLLTLGLTGCGEDDGGTNSMETGEPHPGGSNSVTLGPEGGSVAYGDVIIIIPAGALSAISSIQLGVPQSEPSYLAPDSLTQVGYVYEAGPTDLEFNALIPIAFLYDATFDGEAESTLLLWSLDEAGAEPFPLADIYIDSAENVITGLADHLSYFLLTVSTDALILEPPAAPDLIAPYSGMPGNVLSITLRWKDVPGADYYQIQVAENADFSNLFYYGLGITGNAVGIAGLSINTPYYWRVRGTNQYGEGPWSSGWSFATGDGSNPLTIEGSWELESGEYYTIGMAENEEIDITYWGNLIISFSPASFDVEGERWTHRLHYSLYPENVILDTTYVSTINDEGSYAVTDTTITIESALFLDAYIYEAEERPYSIEEDVLTIRFYDDLYSPQALIFRRI